MEKITKAQLDNMVRAEVVELLGLDKIEGVKKVAGSKYAVDVKVNGEVYVCRIDLVVPKDQDFLAEDLAEEYQEKEQAKAEEKAEKEKAKAKKIERDTKARAKAKAEKGE